MYELAKRNSRYNFDRITEVDTFESALKLVRGDAVFRITNAETGEVHLAQAAYGGGVNLTLPDGSSRRVSRPGASKNIGLGINRKALERGFAVNASARNQDMSPPDLDTIKDMARAGAAINQQSR